MRTARLLNQLEDAHGRFCTQADNITSIAQQYVDWAKIGWEYFTHDGFCLMVGESACPADVFFDIVEERGAVSEEDFYNNAV